MSIYIFAYGSLINMAENAELTNKINKKERKIYPVTVAGLKRSFNVRVLRGEKQYKVLGVKPVANHNIMCNGILFKVSEKELEKLIEREGNYTLNALSPDQLSFKYKYKSTLRIKADDQILYFLPEKKHTLTKKASELIPILPGYLNICLTGARAQGKDFYQDFLGV